MSDRLYTIKDIWSVNNLSRICDGLSTSFGQIGDLEVLISCVEGNEENQSKLNKIYNQLVDIHSDFYNQLMEIMNKYRNEEEEEEQGSE